MTQFQDKTIRFIGKSENPASIEILMQLLNNPETGFRKLAFTQLYLKKSPEVYVRLFKHFLTDQDFWSNPEIVARERLAKITDAALRESSGQHRQIASETALKYKLYEILPTVVLYSESPNKDLSNMMRKVLLQLAESFYNDLLEASPDERRNFDRKRDWFVSELESPIKRYSITGIEEAVQALLIVTKKEFDLMQLVTADHRSAVAKKMQELLRTGKHKSYIRVLLNYVGDIDSPGMMDVIISERSDAFFVRKLLEFVGTDPSPEMKISLKRFQDFTWFNVENPDLPNLVEGLEPNAVQLLESVSFPKGRVIPLYRFFLERESVESRRSAANSVRWLVGEEINNVLFQFVNDSDPQTAATIFRLLKLREVSGIDDMLPTLIERNDMTIQQAIYDMMPELHVETFASRISQMTPMTAAKMGRYVRAIDPKTYRVIDDDIVSPIPIRRAAACKVAMATGYAKDFLHRIIAIAETDDEMPVRLAAISALSSVLVKESLETLNGLSNDRATDIRDAVKIAIQTWATGYRAAQKPKT